MHVRSGSAGVIRKAEHRVSGLRGARVDKCHNFKSPRYNEPSQSTSRSQSTFFISSSLKWVAGYQSQVNYAAGGAFQAAFLQALCDSSALRYPGI